MTSIFTDLYFFF